ncbi:MAG TPA: TIGR01777 family oxidoreductase [Holophagaceae bacterium]|nr:TIGR01777 family oxidoreductase [Holophagaceae bacterium]
MSQLLRKVVIAGGTGLVGRALLEALVAGGTQVVVLTRNPGVDLPAGAQAAAWEALPTALEGTDAVINLAGEGIADRRWNPARKAALLASRVDTTRRLVDALTRTAAGPKVLVNASAVGYYGAHGGEVVDETGAQGKGFLPDVCAAWEREADRAAASGVRVVKLRIGVVLAREGGALPKMALPVRLFNGAKLGQGRQGLSWIHLQDLVAMLITAAVNPEWQGVYNATAPGPVTNETFTRILGKVLHRPILPVPAFVTRAVLPLLVGEMAEPMLLQGAFVYPRRAERQGFTFRFPDAQGAVQDLLG